jgi:hypothetical protein
LSLVVDEIPEGMQLHHRCRQIACVNPDHLTPVSDADHRAIDAALRLTCKKGHEWSPENTWIGQNKKGAKVRKCKACVRDGVKRWSLRNPGLRSAREKARKEAARLANGMEGG